MNRYQMELDHITVPESTVDQLKERAAAPRKKANWHRPVAVAACLALMVAIPVGAAVAKYFTVNHYSAEAFPEDLRWENLKDGFVVENPNHVPGETFSEELWKQVRHIESLEGAYEPQDGYLYFDNWEDAEAFMGYNVLDNGVLERAEKGVSSMLDEDGTVVTTYHCSLYLAVPKWGGLSGVDLRSGYSLNGVHIDLDAHLYTDEDGGVMRYTQSIPEDPDMEAAEYGALETRMTASGTEYTIAFGRYPEHGLWCAQAFLNCGNASVSVHFSDYDESTLLETVQQVMDGFQ